MIIVPVKEGENIEKALKKFKRKFEKTGVIKELFVLVSSLTNPLYSSALRWSTLFTYRSCAPLKSKKLLEKFGGLKKNS